MVDLAEGEQFLWKGRQAWAYSFDRLLFGLLLFLLGMWFTYGGAKGETVAIFLFPIATGYLLYVFLRRGTRFYTVTKRRVFAEVGLVGSRVSEIKLADLRNIQLRQTFFERIWGIGTIELRPESSGTEVVFEGISDPEHLKELINGAMGQR